MKHVKILTVLFLTASLTIGSLASAATFKDVTSSHWAFEAINWATDAGVAKGYPDGTFKPNQTVTEEEFLSMLIRSYKDPLDVGYMPYWSYKYYSMAASMNYPVSGDRTSVITRTWVAEIVAATQGKNYSGTNAIKYMLANGLANGKSGNSVEGYQGSDRLTRAEAVQFIKNVIDKRASDELLPRPINPSDPSEIGQDPGATPDTIEQVGTGSDPIIEGRAKSLHKALIGTGLHVIYNVQDENVLVEDPETEKVIFTYTNKNYKDPKYDVVIQYAWINISGSSKIEPRYLSAINKSLNALGIKVDDNFNKALQKAEDTGEKQSFKIGNETYYINSTNIGRGTITK